MCGIWGCITPVEETVEETQYDFLGVANKTRGARGHGSFVWSSVATNLHRTLDEFRPGVVKVGWSRMALGHNLAPTGEVCTPHPFEGGKYLLAHNGILVGWEKHKPLRPPNLAKVNVDSTVILGGIWFYNKMGLSTADSISRMVGLLEGQQACWLWDREEQALYLWRVMSTLWISGPGGVMYFSSARTHLTQDLIPEGQVIKIDMSCAFPKMSIAGTFDYKSIYRLKEAV